MARQLDRTGERMATYKVPKTEAARLLGVSARTVDRRIAAGELRTERQTSGRRRVLVCLDNARHAEQAVEVERQLGAAHKHIDALETLATVLREQLRASQDREGQLVQTVRELAALPAPRRTPRPWWKFWR